jgi:hypothetical protein
MREDLTPEERQVQILSSTIDVRLHAEPSKASTHHDNDHNDNDNDMTTIATYNNPSSTAPATFPQGGSYTACVGNLASACAAATLACAHGRG